jgi:hypothetical protein
MKILGKKQKALKEVPGKGENGNGKIFHFYMRG